jgi:hypothetical protein
MKQKLHLVSRKTKLLLVIAITLLANFFILPLTNVFATTYLTQPQVILTNMQTSGTSSIIFKFTTSSSNTGTTLSLGFPSYTGSTAGIVNSTQSYSTSYNTSNCTAITGAANNLPTSTTITAAGSSQVITFSGITTLSASTSYCGVLSSTSAITNPTAAGVVSAVLTVGSDAAATLQTDIISNDQILVTATVPSSFTMSLGGTSDSLGTLSSSSVAGSTGVTVTVGTNAKNGWFLYASDINSGLYSSTQTKYIASVAVGSGPTTISSGTEGYDIAVPTGSIVQGSGTGIGTTAAQTYYVSASSGVGGGINTVPRVIAQSSGTAVNAQVVVKEYATISNITPAALDYGDTITLVGAGSF